jgi:hypothetical protein
VADAVNGIKVVTRFLSDLADKHADENIYRGQPNRVWEPMPSVFRPGIFGVKSRSDLDRWKAVAGRFEKAQTDHEWLVLAQHYGIATPLLDWTTNPLVALFFAAQPYSNPGSLGSTDGAVFMIPRSAAIHEKNPSFDIFSTWHGPPLLVESQTMNRRSMAQASVMTLHCEGNHFMAPGYDARIFVVPAAWKQATLSALRSLGISPESIYGDINTAAREFADQLLQEGVTKVFGSQPPPSKN